MHCNATDLVAIARDTPRRLASGLAAAMATGVLLSPVALAGLGQPSDRQLDLQDAATPIMEEIVDLHTLVLVIVSAVTVFVLVLLLWVMIRYNSKANPKPSHNHHNTFLEVAWTVIPIIILVIIAIPSFRLLFNQYDYPKPDLTIKAVGNQWYWSYEYADGSGIAFDSFMLDDAGLAAKRAKGLDAPRLLAVDNEVVVPLGAVVHLLVTSRDVIHSWTIPSFGSKADGVPGRLTATWFQPTKKGAFYGQCSELCGKDHAFMPITVRVVDKPVYEQWVATLKAGGAGADDKAKALLENAELADKPKSVAAAN